MKLNKRISGAGFATFFLLLMVASTGLAQDTTSEGSGLDPELTLKMNGLNPAVGVTFAAADKTDLRVLGYFSTNFDEFGINNRYFLDISFLRSNYWIIDDAAETYMGINLNVTFSNPVIAPGAVAGVSYELSEGFSFFGEVGLNLFIIDSLGTAYLGIQNSGIGMKVAL